MSERDELRRRVDTLIRDAEALRVQANDRQRSATIREAEAEGMRVVLEAWDAAEAETVKEGG